MITKYFTKVFAVVMAALMLTACEGNKKDPREAFVGDYTFTSKGNIDLYAGTLKLFTIPMDNTGELSIVLGKEENNLWVVSDGDTIQAYASGNQLFMDPTSEQTTFKELVLDLSFTYGKATLVENQLSWTSDVAITATYKGRNLVGSGKVDIVATKK